MDKCWPEKKVIVHPPPHHHHHHRWHYSLKCTCPTHLNLLVLRLNDEVLASAQRPCFIHCAFPSFSLTEIPELWKEKKKYLNRESNNEPLASRPTVQIIVQFRYEYYTRHFLIITIYARDFEEKYETIPQIRNIEKKKPH